MSGTSADGIDGVLVRLSDRPTLPEVQAAFHHHLPFSARQREAVFALFDPATASAERVCRMNFELGEWFATAALETLRAGRGAGAGGRRDRLPRPDRAAPATGRGVGEGPQAGWPGSTLQIGEPAVIAERTGITTVADFRVRDVAAGGQGAPLVSYLDDLLFRDRHRTRALLNLGGIANVTLLPPAGVRRRRRWPSTPGRGTWCSTTWPAGSAGAPWPTTGTGASRAPGRSDEAFLSEVVAGDPYFRAPAPKTTGRERYGAALRRALLGSRRRRGDCATRTCWPRRRPSPRRRWPPACAWQGRARGRRQTGGHRQWRGDGESEPDGGAATAPGGGPADHRRRLRHQDPGQGSARLRRAGGGHPAGASPTRCPRAPAPGGRW